MRHELAEIGKDSRHTFTGKFIRIGHKKNYHGYFDETLLLTEIKLDGQTITDHLWFNMTKSFKKIRYQLNEGTEVRFDARVAEYIRGHFRSYQERDFKLSHPTKVAVV
jgi:hypothetical protein